MANAASFSPDSASSCHHLARGGEQRYRPYDYQGRYPQANHQAHQNQFLPVNRQLYFWDIRKVIAKTGKRFIQVGVCQE